VSSSERWAEVKRIFHAAIDLGAADRPALLERECSADAALKKEVESLLASHQEAGDALENPDELWRPVGAPIPDPWLDRKIGPYQPVAKVGEGGMGAVYRAIRVDDHFVKQLAIKVLRDGRLEPSQLRRFKNERQILASLDHPNIARLLDAGTTSDGHPYFVMEFVDGTRIDQYCDAQRLNVVQRVKLFRQVCAAVQFAHQRLVVHRDLKPANILISQDGSPKLLDFGIAKLLDPELFFQTVDLTATAMQPMTPDYASPEQARGEAVTTASDVYSLGVILYRLLTGHPPYQVAKLPPGRMVQAICEQEPEKPSLVISRTENATTHNGSPETLTPEGVSSAREGQPALLRRKLAGDLDNIILKALHKDPARRYGSAEQLANDLTRYLDGLPVQARPDTLWYRAGKYVRRNSVPVAAAALVFACMAVSVLVTARQARIARAAQTRAEKRFKDLQRITHDMIFDVHDAIQYLPGATSARKSLVQDALFYLDNLAKESSDDLALQRELAAAYEKVGDVQGLNVRSNLGETAAALESYRKALGIMQSVVEADPASVQNRRALAEAYNKYAAIQLETGNFGEALEAAKKNLEMTMGLAQESSPADQPTQTDLALAYNMLSDAQVDNNNLDAAVESARKSLAIFETLMVADPANRNYRRNVALEHKKIGGIYEYTGKLDAALAEDQAALPFNVALAAEDPNDTLARRDLSISYSSIGDVLLRKGTAVASLKLYQQAAAIDDAIAAQDPKDAWALNYQIYDGTRVGDALAASGQLPAARAAYHRTVELAERWASLDGMNVRAQADLASAYARMAGTYYVATPAHEVSPQQKRADLLAAQSLYQKSLAIWNQLRAKGAIGPEHEKDPKSVAEGLANCQRALNGAGGR
jgi:non-specific serine/threonine protein kinase/serine/threonine-protein kinase